MMETDACEANIQERVIPVENIQLMFHYKKPFAVCKSDLTLSLQPRTVVSGLSNTFSDVTTLGESGVIFVEFHPAGACQFFNFPLSELENKSIDLTDALGREARQAEEQLYNSTTVRQKIDLVEQFLLNRFKPVAPYDYALVETSLTVIKETGGKIPAATLANRLSVTSKTLERKFAAYIGKTPRQYSKLIRFRQILKDLSSIKNVNLTEHACRNGYFDQSHFIHDFKMYTGHTPKEFLLKYPEFTMSEYE